MNERTKPKQSRAIDAEGESRRNELEGPKSPPRDLVRQRSLEKQKEELESRLEEKCKKLGELDRFSCELGELKEQGSEINNKIEIIKVISNETEKELKDVNGMINEIKKLYTEFKNIDLIEQINKIEIIYHSKYKNNKKSKKLSKEPLKELLLEHKNRLKDKHSLSKSIINNIKDLHTEEEEILKDVKQVNEFLSSQGKTLGIEFKIDLDARFIQDTDDCRKKINEVRNELKLCKRAEKRNSKGDNKCNRAVSQVKETRYWRDYYIHVRTSEIGEQLEKNLSLAIEPKVGQEREKVQDLENNTILENMVIDADALIKYREDREVKKLNAKSKIDDMKIKNEPHKSIAEECLHVAMQASEAVEKGTLSNDQIVKLRDHYFVRKFSYFIEDKMQINQMPSFFEIYQFFQAIEEENKQREKVVGFNNSVKEQIKNYKQEADKAHPLMTEEDRKEFESSVENLIKTALGDIYKKNTNIYKNQRNHRIL